MIINFPNLGGVSKSVVEGLIASAMTVETARTESTYMNINSAYTKAEIDEIIAELPSMDIVVVDELPSSGIEKTIYLLRLDEPAASNLFEEYLWVNGAWELLGTARINLDDYYTKSETDTLFANESARTESTYVKAESLSGYVTESYVDSAITGVENEIIEVERVTSIALNELHTNKADKTEIPSVSGYATETYVNVAIAAESARTEATYLKEHQSLSGYATEAWVEGQGYLKEHQSLSGYATETYVDNAVAIESARTESTYLKEHQSLSGYATEAYVDNALSGKQDTLTAGENITISGNTISAAGGDLSNYYTKTQTDALLVEKANADDVEDYERTAAEALLELKASLSAYTTEAYVDNAVSDKVASVSISTIWKGTQAEYDAITVKDNNTLYCIV